MPAITQQDTRWQVQFAANTGHSLHAGLVAVEAMARRFDLWRQVRQLPGLHPSQKRTRGSGPEVIGGQLICALCSASRARRLKNLQNQAQTLKLKLVPA